MDDTEPATADDSRPLRRMVFAAQLTVVGVAAMRVDPIYGGVLVVASLLWSLIELLG